MYIDLAIGSCSRLHVGSLLFLMALAMISVLMRVMSVSSPEVMFLAIGYVDLNSLSLSLSLYFSTPRGHPNLCQCEGVSM